MGESRAHSEFDLESLARLASAGTLIVRGADGRLIDQFQSTTNSVRMDRTPGRLKGRITAGPELMDPTDADEIALWG